MKWHRIAAMLKYYYHVSISSADRIFDIIYWPILDLLIWGFMTHFITGISEVNILSMILGGIVLWVFIWRTSQDFVVYLLENWWSRNIYHLFATPLKKSEMVISLCILGLVRSMVSFLVLSVLSFLLYKFNVFSFNYLHLSLLISILLIFGWGVGMFVSSLVFWFGTRVQVLAWSTIWIIQPFSCVFYPLSALPEWAALVAKILPTTHVFEALRASLAGLPISYGSLAYAFVASLILVGITGTLLVHAMNTAKKVGTFAKPE